ncbi:hypothetical protein PTTW11_04269 [Pyrenophora teres f. teres]|uniref:Uncharacterized protein n=1 Tax=Pyrenophora teres f. teres TaxID=97479 RepID=A0A6S6VYM2_9PLEO|nr:hypothetical protein PTTW11_04269 [Pyrenophora teres f. teres]
MDQPFFSPAPHMLQTYNNRDNATGGNIRVDPATVFDGMIDPLLEYILWGSPSTGDSSENHHNQALVPQTTDNCRLTAEEASRLMPPPPSVRGHATRSARPYVPQPGTPRGQLLLGIPPHDYMLPQGGLINATVVDIIVIFPQWFRNPRILQRFLNNGITANIHLIILEEYRHLGLTSGEQLERARDYLSNAYRKQMRKYSDPKWTKQTHRAPVDWNMQALSIHDFTPECMVSGDLYVTPPSIPFKDLAIGLKKLPEGNDAGDLTHALDYAMRNHKLDEKGYPADFVFPDDIQLILNAIGRISVTSGNTDASIITRYHHMLRDVEVVRRRKLSEDHRQIADARKQQELAVQVANQWMDQSHTHQMPMWQPVPFENGPTNWQVPQPAPTFQPSDGNHGGMLPTDMGVLMPTHIQQLQMPIHQPQHHYPVSQETNYSHPGTTNQTVPSRPSHLLRTPSQDAVAEVAAKLVSHGLTQTITDLPPIPSICVFSPSEDNASLSQLPPQQPWQPEDPIAAQQQADAWIAANQTFDLNGLSRLPMYPSMLLQECANCFTADDMSDIARAARWAVAFGYADDVEWTVGDAEMIVGILDAAANGFEGV